MVEQVTGHDQHVGTDDERRLDQGREGFFLLVAAEHEVAEMAVGGVQEPHGLVVSPVDSVDARLAILVAYGAADLQCPVDVAEDKYAVVPVLLAFAVYGGNGTRCRVGPSNPELPEWLVSCRRSGPARVRAAVRYCPAAISAGPRLAGRAALPGDVFQRQAEGGGQRGHGEESGRGNAPGLDLAQRLGGHARRGRDLGHAACPAGRAQHDAELFPAGVLEVGEGRPDHTVILIPV